ncbi:MAG: hypothetical protein Q7R35_03260 [Elusimicrobiota bacterium]|nr:hypothetical protein [Elusimicrobiota bacterium]
MAAVSGGVLSHTKKSLPEVKAPSSSNRSEFLTRQKYFPSGNRLSSVKTGLVENVIPLSKTGALKEFSFEICKANAPCLSIGSLSLKSHEKIGAGEFRAGFNLPFTFNSEAAKGGRFGDLRRYSPPVSLKKAAFPRLKTTGEKTLAASAVLDTSAPLSTIRV